MYIKCFPPTIVSSFGTQKRKLASRSQTTKRDRSSRQADKLASLYTDEMSSQSINEKISPPSRSGSEEIKGGHSHEEPSGGLHRRLTSRQVQLVAIGGSIGTGLFISVGAGLAKGGPANMLICYILYSMVVALVNNSIAEMSTYMPVSGGFIRLAGEWVDDALGFMVGWNFFLYEALLIPFEVTALNLVLSFWNDKMTEPGPTAGICAAVIISYG